MKKLITLVLAVFLFACNSNVQQNHEIVKQKLVSIDSAITALKEVGGLKYLEIDKDYKGVTQMLPPFDISFYYQNRGFDIGGCNISTIHDSIAVLLKKELDSVGIKYTCERRALVYNNYMTIINYDTYYLPTFYKTK